MHEIHCHRHGHSAGAHVISSRAHLSVKPDTSMIVAYPTFSTTVFQTNGFWTTHQRPRGFGLRSADQLVAPRGRWWVVQKPLVWNTVVEKVG